MVVHRPLLDLAEAATGIDTLEDIAEVVAHHIGERRHGKFTVDPGKIMERHIDLAAAAATPRAEDTHSLSSGLSAIEFDGIRAKDRPRIFGRSCHWAVHSNWMTRF